MTAVFFVIVNNSDFVLDSITAVPPPEGLLHYLGDSFKSSGLNVLGTFKDKDGKTEEKKLSAFSVQGYDRAKRGEQTVTVSANGKTATVPVMVKVPASADLVSVYTVGTNVTSHRDGHNTAFIKGQALELANAQFRVQVQVNGADYTLRSGDHDGDGEEDGIYPEDIRGFDPSRPGFQTLSLALDEKEVPVEVYVADIEPKVYFDYGFMRTSEHPDGLWYGEGFHTVPNRTVVLSPVRVLLGYEKDNTPLPVSYAWTVSPVSGGEAAAEYSADNEFLRLTPQEEGRWQVSVTVRGGIL